MSKTPAINCKKLCVSYQTGVAISDVNIWIKSGVMCGIVGMNGAGKSTFFKALMSVVKYQGQIKIAGEDAKTARKKQLVSYSPQTEQIDWTMPVSVMDVVMMGRYGKMNFFKKPSVEDRRRVLEALEKVGLKKYASRQISELSGGQKKRIFVARALAQEAEILLLDEPFAGVDFSTQSILVKLLKKLTNEGKTVLIALHDLDQVKKYCDEVVMINQKIVASGKTSEVMTLENITKAFSVYCEDELTENSKGSF